MKYLNKNKILHLITEAKSEVQILKEASDISKPKTMKFRGIFAVSEKRNGNDRIYPYEELKREVERFKKEMINTNRALMELEHPESSEINPARASARILSMEEDNRQWIGEGVILCSDEKFGIKGTPCGDILAALTTYGTKWGVSTRAMGSIDDNGLVSDLHLVTIDTVVNPSIGEMVSSSGNRFIDGILESKQWICNSHGRIVENKFNNFEKRISHTPRTFIKSKKQLYLKNAVTDFLKELGM